jgi:ubiquinone biosynthesis monooxygenase Coq7
VRTMEVIARLAADETLGDRVIKVNHAGEHGAVNIYRAQLLACWWRKSDLKSELRGFLDHEKRHRAIFASELTRRGRPRCRSYWLCGVGGFVLGLVTGFCGRPSIAATTVAVETVVLRHLEAQMSVLSSADPAAVSAIRSIFDDELAHRNRAANESRAGIFWPRVLRPLVSWATEAVIWLGMRL